MHRTAELVDRDLNKNEHIDELHCLGDIARQVAGQAVLGTG
jgi:hypothetical protein